MQGSSATEVQQAWRWSALAAPWGEISVPSQNWEVQTAGRVRDGEKRAQGNVDVGNNLWKYLCCVALAFVTETPISRFGDYDHLPRLALRTGLFSTDRKLSEQVLSSMCSYFTTGKVGSASFFWKPLLLTTSLLSCLVCCWSLSCQNTCYFLHSPCFSPGTFSWLGVGGG